MPQTFAIPLYDAESMPYYHGRKVLAALFMAGFMVYGGGLYCFVLLVPPLIDEFHWSHAATGGLVTAFWLSAPLILLGGAAIKRFGATRLLIAGVLIEAACVALLSTVSTFGEMYFLRAAMGVGKVMFAVTLPYTVSRWFSRHYSLGLGIVWAGWHVGGMILVPITGVIIAHHGWRTACLATAVGLVTLGLVPVLATKGPARRETSDWAWTATRWNLPPPRQLHRRARRQQRQRHPPMHPQRPFPQARSRTYWALLPFG